ncbi:hypothetical protein MKX01_000619 [Papaver californicum]|nr:hypothetical protein MKX01_000619 [Papaver californicum]
MDKIQHKYVDARGLKLHIAEFGTGDQVVLFLHGFPEIWYSWRYQMIAVANAYVNWKDFGALTAYQFAILHPERVKGVVTCGIPYVAPGGFELVVSQLPEGFYIPRWKEPVGRAEADFGRLEVKNVVLNIYVLFSKSELPIAEEDEEIMDLVDESHPGSVKKISQLMQPFMKNLVFVLRCKSLAEGFPISNPIIKTPALLIMGGKDYILKLPGIEEYIASGAVKEHVPDLEIKFLPEGNHFLREQYPDEVNELIITFLKKYV